METINIKVNKITEEDFEIELPFYGQIGYNLVAIEDGNLEMWYTGDGTYISARHHKMLSNEHLFQELNSICKNGITRLTSDDIQVISRHEFLARRAELYNSMIRK